MAAPGQAMAMASTKAMSNRANLETTVVPLRAYSPAPPPDPQAEIDAERVTPLDAQRVDRITGGVDAQLLQSLARVGYARWLDEQLHPRPAILPAAVSERIAALDITRLPLAERVQDENASRATARQQMDVDQRAADLKSYQQDLTRQALEADQRWLLAAVNSPNQVQERMVWFWLNHFSVGQKKSNLRSIVGDYEQALRAHALGKFRDLLEASALSPAMLRFLDNDRNAVGKINENYAREIMELHTLGVDAGYSQKDVQELARVLTGLGVRSERGDAHLQPALAVGYVHQGLLEFNPARHDHEDKVLLGAPVRAGGLDEVRQVLDRLARSPATAHHVCAKLAQFFVSDTPPPALVDRMAKQFLATDGDIAAVLKVLFTAPEFDASLGKRFKDPWEYVVSATRLVYDGSTVVNAGPLINALGRL
ncbi:MAG TPA: DUF1800 domain-containing protein, partial [Burkholderiaceae bacterium]|nr:DUF1800 domain-containing protein [Burkholderiaceae bacterium]